MRLRSKLLLVIAGLAVGQCVGGEVLPGFGPLLDPGKNWVLREKGEKGSDPSFQWHWVILTNAETGDVLSYAARKLEPGDVRELKYHSDTAHEIFRAGDPIWPTWPAGPKRPRTLHSIRNKVTKLNLGDLSQEALEYSFIEEEERGTNLLAHGYAFVFDDDVAVYLQHTSTKPIAPEFAYDRAMALLTSRSRQKAAAKNEQPASTP